MHFVILNTYTSIHLVSPNCNTSAHFVTLNRNTSMHFFKLNTYTSMISSVWTVTLRLIYSLWTHTLQCISLVWGVTLRNEEFVTRSWCRENLSITTFDLHGSNAQIKVILVARTVTTIVAYFSLVEKACLWAQVKTNILIFCVDN